MSVPPTVPGIKTTPARTFYSKSPTLPEAILTGWASAILYRYFDDFSRRLNNQYELGFAAPLRGKAQVETLKVKVSAPDIKVTAPKQVWVAPAGPATE